MQREARHIEFDFSALCKKAIQACPGDNRIARQEKKEGSYNRAFLLHMDNGARVVARVPFRVVGPRRLTTNFEVATMAYTRAHTSVPVPRVLDLNDDPTNPTGTEYIIMEHASGVQLHEKWNTMNTLQQMLCVKSAAILVKEMAKLQFPAYGSLYFADAPINPSLKLDLSNGLCIGPHCATKNWCLRKSNRGPWTDVLSYCSGLIDTGFSRIPSTAPADGTSSSRIIKDHLHLLEVSEQVFKEVIKSPVIQNVSATMLLHPEFHKRNIFVSDDDTTRLTAVIDWQSTGVEPVFSFANETPDMVADRTIDMPLFEDEPDTSPSQAQSSHDKKCEKKISICEQTFEVALKGWVPNLHDARALDETLLRPIRYCHTSWRDGAAALRQELIELSQRWNELGLPNSCPYQPFPQELTRHAKEWEDFETFQSLRLFLVRSINSNTDSWVPSKAWEAAKDANQSAFEEWMKTAAQSEDPDMNEDRGRKLWPFDVNIDG
ncbi:kinase subdomain-containing protein [Clathrospora elynae]|uniref:Altered inheritance of mitochondria protein 9, mitochondrial n=1 Tax=Clathrospora elynae TaxID=706981 RepID=A0A6A5SVQ4_9PLEO|nr:kinase subdomain-containing protein [Clathrospora elynae]